MAAAGGSKRQVVRIDGCELALSNLGKVLYPEAGFTKGEVIDYYSRIAPVMLEHLGDRAITLKRYPDGVEAGSFFEKRCPSHRPDWVQVAPGPGDRGGAIDYCRLADRPSLVWAANMAALELHAPMARVGDIETPTMVVFDLDPGAPAAMTECARVGLLISQVLEGIGLRSVAKTSGSKGLQLYVPVNRPCTHEQASGFSYAVAAAIAKEHNDEVVVTQKKSERAGKVLIDWSQNSRHKTTVCAYSLRGRPRPTVSTPVSWDEVEAAADGASLSFETGEVLERVETLGDLFAEAATFEQDLPSARR